MKKMILIFFLLTIVIEGNAQSKVQGKVLGDDGQPVEFATVIVQTLDSVFVNSEYTDSIGHFSVEASLPQYRLIVQHMMYQTFEKLMTTNNVGTLTLQSNDHVLGEVVVSVERPVVKVTNGRLTYDMETLLNKKVSQTAYDALFQLPGVVEKSGMPTLIGSNSLAVIINGKVSTMTSDQVFDLLRNMPSDRILKAEVMYSAPAQYHIRGAVINLVLKQAEAGVFQGQVNTSYTQKFYDNYSVGANLGYSSFKFSTDVMYSLSQNKTRSGLVVDSKHTYKDSLYNIEQRNRGNRKNLNHNIRANVNYTEGKNDLNLTYTAQITAKVKNREISTGNFSDSENTKTDETPTQMHNVNLGYTFDKKLSVGVDYTYYNNKMRQNYLENLENKEGSFISLSNQQINRLKANIDHSIDLNETSTLNYGAQMQYNEDYSYQKYTDLQGNALDVKDTDSRLKEYTYSAYVGMSKQFSDKLSGSLSVTGEYYKLGDLKQWSVFPTLDLTYVYSPSNVFQFSFSTDRNYPSYWELSNTIGYINGYAQLWGNPDLQPSRDYTAQFNYVRNSKYVITAYYEYNDKAFVQLPYQSTNDLQLIYQTTNFKYDQTIGLSAVVPATWGILSSRLTANVYYNKVASDSFHDLSFNKSRTTLYSRLDNTLNISNKPNIKLEFAGSYLSPSLQGPMNLSHVWNLEAGIKWTSNNEKAILSIKGYDLLNSWVPDVKSRFSNQNLTMNTLHDSRYFSANFIYKFGKDMKKSKAAQVDTSRFGY